MKTKRAKGDKKNAHVVREAEGIASGAAAGAVLITETFTFRVLEEKAAIFLRRGPAEGKRKR